MNSAPSRQNLEYYTGPLRAFPDVDLEVDDDSLAQ
jgi:hypothetical protein